MAMFSSTFSIWFGSTRVCHKPSLMKVSSATASPKARRISSCMRRSRRPRSVTSGFNGWRRAKASSCDDSLAPPLDGRGGRIEAPGRLRVIGHRQFQQLQIAGNDLQHVIEIVGHAARQLADRFQLLRLQ